MDTPPLAAPSDADLAVAIARGELAAEAMLYARFSARVLYFARRELHSRELAEEARNETFLRVIEAIRAGRLRSAASLASFVLQTARHVIQETIRQRRRAAELDADDLWPMDPVADAVDPNVVEAVRDVLRDLSARDRAFLRMYYYDELDKEEIAKRLGIAPERVRLIKSRALHRFRRAFEARG